MCISEVLWSWCNFKLTSSGFAFHVAASGIFPDVEFVLTYISKRNLELLQCWCFSSCQDGLPGDIITSSREGKPWECFEKENPSPSTPLLLRKQQSQYLTSYCQTKSFLTFLE